MKKSQFSPTKIASILKEFDSERTGRRKCAFKADVRQLGHRAGYGQIHY